MGCSGSRNSQIPQDSSILKKKVDLHALTARRDMPGLKAVLDAEPERVNELNFDGLTPLLIGSYKGYDDIVSLLLERGAGGGIDLCDKEGRTSLHRALHWGHMGVALMLISVGGANLTTPKDLSGKTCMDIAKANKKLTPDMISQLIKSREDVDKDLQPFLTAAKEGPLVALISHCDKRRKLMDKKVCPTAIDFKDHTGKSALYLASENNKLQHVKVIVEKGANLETEAHDSKDTPLLVAAKNGFTEIAQFLIDQGADGMRKDARGMCAFDYLPVDLKHKGGESKMPSRLGGDSAPSKTQTPSNPNPNPNPNPNSNSTPPPPPPPPPPPKKK